MDVIDLIKEDHSKVSDLLERLAITTEEDVSVREELFPQLMQLLKAHATSEEEVVYNKAQQKKELKSIITKSFEEHAAVDELLDSLQNTDVSVYDWSDEFKNLKQAVEQHKNKEELQLLPLIKQTFSFDAREEMCDRMKAIEDDFMKHDVSKVRGFESAGMDSSI
jgi:hemerythrin superfamily protein